MPGKARWVTTTIFRFDPDEDWPTDLDCNLHWTSNLTSYDGAPLLLDRAPPIRSLTSDGLGMQLTGATSKLAEDLTDGLWSPTADGGPCEVPPDGKLMTSFSYPVNLAMLKSALKVVEASNVGGPTVPFDVGPCQSAAPWSLAADAAAASAVNVGTSASGLSLDVNTTCAEITINAPLKPDTSYQLLLPPGARYNSLAGPTRGQKNVNFAGLRPFKLQFTNAFNEQSGTSFRRLDLWLLHGLSSDTAVEAFARQVSLCELPAAGGNGGCADTPFTLVLLSRGVARLSVPSLKPRTPYRISVAANPAVKDGFGQGLQSSSATFWTSALGYNFGGPSVPNHVVILEAGAESLQSWPYITRSPPPAQLYFSPRITSSVSGWELDLRDDRTKTLLARVLKQGIWNDNPASLFGQPTVTLDVPSPLRSADGNVGWTELLLPLQAATGPYKALLVCDFIQEGDASSVKLLVNTSLSVNVVQAGASYTVWVLDGALGGGPVAGAAASLYQQPSYAFGSMPEPVLLAACITGADGACTINATTDGYAQLVAFVVAGDQVAVLESAGFTSPPRQPSPFVASLVADRLVVVPGDTIKITGFVQQASAAGLQLPPASYATLSVSPHWQQSSGGDVPRRGLSSDTTVDGAAVSDPVPFGTSIASSSAVMPQNGLVASSAVMPQGGSSSDSISQAPPAYTVAKINGTTGTLHAEILVPADARMQSYTISLGLPPAGGKAGGDPSGPEPDIATQLSWETLLTTQLRFVVADPRPPTAELKLEATPWVLPTGVAVVNVTAVSYIGASVDAAAIRLTWRTARAAGVAALVTDLHGFAQANIDLGALPEANRTTAYDTLYIEAEWIGPTRERITRSASVTLADGPARLALQLSLQTDIPGTAFAVAATLTSNSDATPVTGVPVAVTLRPADGGSACTINTSCTTSSGSRFSSLCQLALPCVGHFLLEACADLPASAGSAGQRVCCQTALGRNASEWAAQPLNKHPNPFLATDKTSYAPGEQVKLTFQNPWPNASMLVIWGNSFKTRSRVVMSLAAGLMEESIGPLGDESVGGAAVTIVLDVPRSGAQPARAQLPTSRLFDPLAPHTHTLSTLLDVRPDNALSVDIALAPAGSGAASTILDVDGAEVIAIEPGAEAQVTVSVRSGLLTDSPVPPAGSVEVTVYAVDKAFLDLLPYALPHPEKEVLLRLAADMRSYGLAPYRLAPGAVRAVYDKLMARLTGQDPWLPLDTAVYAGGLAAVDVEDAAYLAGFGTPITIMPSWNYYNRYQNWPGMSDMAQGPAALADGMVNSGSAEAGDSADAGSSKRPSSSDGGSTVIRLESTFLVTPLFATGTTGPDGRVTVSFKAPSNLGTFVLRAFAASGSSARYGAGEGKVAVRRRLSLTPSVPRFVRVGDAFEAGVVVTVGSAPATVTVELQINDSADSPLTLTGTTLQTATFAAAGGLQQEVRFSFSAAAVGTAVLTFSASDGQPGGGRDGLQLEIPVLGQQGDVWVATSFALTALPPSDTSVVQWQEGMDLPAAVPGSGNLTLTAGVGYYPTIAAVYDNLLRTEPERSYSYAPTGMLWVTLPAVQSYYDQPVSAEQAAAVTKAAQQLSLLTGATVGLQWSDPSRWNGWWPSRTDLYLNTWALFLAAQHGPALRSAAGPLAARWAELEAWAVPTWRLSVARQMVADAVAARAGPYPRPYSDWDSLAWAALALGPHWVPAEAPAQAQEDLALSTLISNNKSMSRQSRVVLSLALQLMGAANPAPQLLAATLDELTSALRVQGRTTYLAAGDGSASASSLTDQALGLLLLLRGGVTHQLLPKLAAYVANPTSVGGYGIFTVCPSWMEQGVAVAALSEYDRVRGSSKPNVDLLADVDGLTVLEASFHTGGSTQPVTNSTAWEDLPVATAGSTSGLNFEVTGSGEVSVAASLHFVPAALLAFPTYRGLYVESALQLMDPLTGRPTGQRLAAVPLGSVVVYSVQLTTPDDLGAVTLSVLMPGGLEPLDPNIAAGVQSSCEAGLLDSGAWNSFFRWWWWPVCPAQETRPAVVTFSYLALRAGTSSVTLRAVAATAGSFVVPPVRAAVDAQPELMGMTAAASITVGAKGSQPQYGVAQPPLNDCPRSCSGNGVCNLLTGRCRCDGGFTRADCSRPVA